MEDEFRKVIVTALHTEAAPLIDHFGLVKDGSAPLPVFRGEDMVLAVSGIGKIRSATTVGYLAAAFEIENVEMVLNVGIAGAHPDMGARIGELFLVNKIVDSGSGREFFPDMLVKSDIPEEAVFTSDHVVTDVDPGGPVGLVDMEASGFYEGAASFWGPHALACLKVVSDFFQPKGLSRGVVDGLIRAKVPVIAAFMDGFESAVFGMAGGLGSANRSWIEKVANELHLTATQRSQLKKWVVAFVAARGPTLPDVASWWDEPVEEKKEGKRRLEEIRKALESA